MTDTARSLAPKATELLRLHHAPEILQLVNVWDVVSASVVAAVRGTTALATASHSIAATFGYEDGENIPLDLMLEMVGRIVAATDLPVTADLEGGYGDPAETVRRAIGSASSAPTSRTRCARRRGRRNVEAVMRAAEAEGVDFVLNARTDAFLKGRDRDPAEVLADAIERGRAFLDAGAPVVFVPGLLDEPTVTALVEGIGWNKVSVINVPGSLAPATLQELGVARISYGPWTQRVALTALADATAAVLAGGALPEGTRALN